MLLWDAAIERFKQEHDEEWYRAYATGRDSYSNVRGWMAGKRPKNPDYIERIQAERRKRVPTPKPQSTMTQLQSLELLFPNNIQVSERPGEGSSSAKNGRR